MEKRPPARRTAEAIGLCNFQVNPPRREETCEGYPAPRDAADGGGAMVEKGTAKTARDRVFERGTPICVGATQAAVLESGLSNA